MSKLVMLLVILMVISSKAQAYSENVKNNCRGDYFAHCSYLDPYSRGVQDCMYYNRRKLSLGCKVALVKEGFLKRYMKR